MPELPEVENIRLGLQKHLVGHIIERVEVKLPRIFHGDMEIIKGTKVEAVSRFGKGLVIDLSNGYSIAVHVKMTGKLIYMGDNLLVNKHTHVIFYLNNKSTLIYNDIRKFGWIKVVKTADVQDLLFFKSLGPEPLKDLTSEKFQKLLHGLKTPIKQVLMDQSKIAGVGNIYANDSLFQAGILPTRPATSLSDKEVKLLLVTLEEILRKSIKLGGASSANYVNVLGEKGNYQNHFLVYKREGKACLKCKTEIKKIKFGGRGTFFCPNCQK